LDLKLNCPDVKIFFFTFHINAALHYAAQSGFKKCIEYLIAHGADPFLENKAGMTACDIAIRENHHEIAILLESRMVFSGTPGNNQSQE